MQLTVRPFGLNHEFGAVSIHLGRDAKFSQRLIFKVSQHGRIVCDGHRKVMVRAVKKRRLFLVALDARFATDEFGCGIDRKPRIVVRQQVSSDQRQDDGGENDRFGAVHGDIGRDGVRLRHSPQLYHHSLGTNERERLRALSQLYVPVGDRRKAPKNANTSWSPTRTPSSHKAKDTISNWAHVLDFLSHAESQRKAAKMFMSSDANAMSKSNSSKRESERLEWLRSKLEAAGCADGCFRLSALPRPSFAVETSSIGNGLAWCPQGLPDGSSIHVASSRLSRQLESFPVWFDAIRTFGSNFEPDCHFIVTSETTTTDRWVVRLGELFDLPVVRVARFPKRVTAKWIEQQKSRSSGRLRTMWIEPALDVSQDDVLISIASEVRVLRVRGGGNVHRAIMRRLETSSGRTWLLVDPSLTKQSESEKIIRAGATGWWLYPSQQEAPDPPSSDTDRKNAEQKEAPSTQAKVIAAQQIDSSQYAIHWTRRRHGAWPDQSDPDYLDDLIFRRDSSDHRTLSVLRRILMTQRLIASNDLTRDATPVVCFADVRLAEIKNRRTFRSHLGRWDFEPYGIAIRKETLKKHGARAVIYGDESDWNELAKPDRPFFQLAGEDKDPTHDWRSEREIRLCGDLALKRIGPADAVVLVTATEDAQQIAALSRWPVVVLDD